MQAFPSFSLAYNHRKTDLMWLQGTSTVYNGNFSHTPRAVLLQRQFCTILHQRFSYLQKSNLAIDKNGRLWQFMDSPLWNGSSMCRGSDICKHNLWSDQRQEDVNTHNNIISLYIYIYMWFQYISYVYLAIVMSTPTISYNELMWIPKSFFDFHTHRPSGWKPTGPSNFLARRSA